MSDRSGVHEAGWILGGVAVLAVILLAATVRGMVRAPTGVPLEPAFAADQFRPDDDPQWPGHWVDPPGPWEPLLERVDTDLLVDEARDAIADLPSPQHEVIVARDVQGRSPAEVSDELGLTVSEERDLLNQARGRVRSQVDERLRGDGT